MTPSAPLPALLAPPSPPDADQPAHYRLSDDTWDIILQEYREGATAPFLSRKWRVSEHAIRRRITVHKATKRDWGDAQAIGQALAREAELDEARRNSPEAVAARLFEGIGALDEAAAGDPAALARLATRASGRAMTGRLWAEARALVGLAESYARLAASLGPSDAGELGADGAGRGGLRGGPAQGAGAGRPGRRDRPALRNIDRRRSCRTPPGRPAPPAALSRRPRRPAPPWRSHDRRRPPRL